MGTATVTVVVSAGRDDVAGSGGGEGGLEGDGGARSVDGMCTMGST